MTKEEFASLVAGERIYLDGATGSNLQKAGMPSGVCPDLWISENPEALINLQLEFLRAGSRIVYAPTFTANRVKLAEYGLEGRLKELNKILVGESKEAIRRFHEENPDAPECFVAGDVTMTGLQLKPIGQLEFEELIDIYKEQITALNEAGADLIVVETMMSLQETRAAVIAAKEVCDLPVIATMTFEGNGRSLYGTDPVTALITLQSLGVSAFGANCSTGPEHMVPMIKKMCAVAEIPIICKPNAGLPELDENGNTVYRLNPEEFGRDMEEIVRSGARILGGCCGTTPDHIRALHEHTVDMDVSEPESDENADEPVYYLTSERKTLEFGLNGRFMIVGERINPTGKKALQAELREGCFDIVADFAEEQDAKGASVLDVNVGMSGVDEKALMIRAIDEVTQIVKLPLAIDTSHVDIMEAALRRYPGRALMNSISLETAKCEPMLHLAKKYGAAFILLPLSDAGLPKSLEEKKNAIRTVMEKALEIGLRKTDIIVDGLVGTVGASPTAALETLETIRFCHDELGLATICGLSNISFGLPERINVNTAFLTLAIQAGLTMAIANPNQEALVTAAKSADMLLAKPESDVVYIEHVNEVKALHEDEIVVKKSEYERLQALSAGVPADAGIAHQAGEKPGKTDAGPDASHDSDAVWQAVMKGRRKTIADTVQEALDAGRTPQDILNESLLPAIDEVGKLFDQKKYFLPQLIASGEAMKNGIAVIEPLLQEGKDDSVVMPTIVIATVEGDIHDIGKNLVVLMLKNFGFNVIDLGKDVPKEEIVRTAIDNKADIIALSALMTTTMREMKNVIDHARNCGLDCHFMIGGAVITPEYAEEINANYSSDAADAVRVAKKLTGMA
ncbi:5-methyltetrahydrofolate--homocysteine methyltransferase [Lachnospiraceae bacterium]|nr:5-methyltetrahydrofolate--homocysteine methyltransferase [Lachnospiraceae bacterium]